MKEASAQNFTNNRGKSDTSIIRRNTWVVVRRFQKRNNMNISKGGRDDPSSKNGVKNSGQPGKQSRTIKTQVLSLDTIRT